MAEQKPTPKPAPAPKLARAAESGDPAVQWLLAEQATWGSVGNTVKVAEYEQRLNELGYTTK
jgi:hypothetical protein